MALVIVYPEKSDGKRPVVGYPLPRVFFQVALFTKTGGVVYRAKVYRRHLWKVSNDEPNGNDVVNL